MRYFRGPILALVTFVIGVAISPIHFYVESIACGRLIDGGGGFSIRNYRSNYFVQVSFAHAAYASTEKANDVFEAELRKALYVVDLTPKLDENGVLAGRRAMAIFFDAQAKKRYASVFWTDGRFLHSIDSYSYLHVIEFEKRNR